MFHLRRISSLSVIGKRNVNTTLGFSKIPFNTSNFSFFKFIDWSPNATPQLTSQILSNRNQTKFLSSQKKNVFLQSKFRFTPISSPFQPLTGNFFYPKRFFAEAASSQKPNEPPKSNVKSIEELEKGAQEVKPKYKKGRKRLRAPDEAWAVIKNIRVSHKKLNYVARTIRGLSYHEAIRQLKFCPKRIGRTVVLRAVESCRYNAENIHKLNPERCIIYEAWVGRHSILKRPRYHAKGRAGIMYHRYSRLTIVLKEIPYVPEEKKLGKIGWNHPPNYEERLKQSLSNPTSSTTSSPP